MSSGDSNQEPSVVKIIAAITAAIATINALIQAKNVVAISFLISIAIVFLFRPNIKPNGSNEENSNGGFFYHYITSLFPEEKFDIYRKRYVGLFLSVTLWLFSLSFLFLLPQYVPYFLIGTAFIIVLIIALRWRRISLRSIILASQNLKIILFSIINFVKRYWLGFLLGITISALLANLHLLLPQEPFPDSKYSEGNHVLIKQNTNWLEQENTAQQPWQKKCVDNWNSKIEGTKNYDSNKALSNQEFIKFTQNCDDSEARIYLNNLEAANKNDGLIKIAVSVPISRRDGVFDAMEVLRGVASAQADINMNGISLGDKKTFLQVAVADDGNSDDLKERIEAEKAARFLVSKEDVLGVIGHFSSDATESASKIYENQKVVLISPTSTAVRKPNDFFLNLIPFQGDGLALNSYVFRSAPNDAEASRILVNYLKTLNERTGVNTINKVGVIRELNNRYGKLYKDYFIKELKERQIKIQVIDDKENCAFNFKAGDFNSQLQNCKNVLKEQGARALLLVPSTKNVQSIDSVIRVIKEAKNSDSDLLLIGGDSMYKKSFISPTYGLITERMVIAIPARRQTYSTGEESWRTAMAYDATRAMVHGLEEAYKKQCSHQSLPINKCLREKLQQELTSDGFKADGMSGLKTIEFDRNSRDRKVDSIDQDRKINVLVCVQKENDSFDFKYLRPGKSCQKRL